MFLAAVGVLGFSFTLPMTKIAVRGLDPMLAAAGRGAVAAVLAAIALRTWRCTLPTPRQLRRLAIVVVGVVVGFPLLTAYAMRLVPGSHGAVLTGLLPLVTAGVAVARAGERPSGRYWACSLVGLGAVVWFALGEGGGSLHLADLLLLGGVLAAAVGYNEGALLAREMPGWQVVSWALVLAAPLTVGATAWAVAAVGQLDATAGQWAAFGYTAAVSMFFAFFAWYAGLARAGIAKGGQLQLAQPVLTILWGWPLLGERLTVAATVTAVVVLAAVAVGRHSTVGRSSLVAGGPQRESSHVAARCPPADS